MMRRHVLASCTFGRVCGVCVAVDVRRFTSGASPCHSDATMSNNSPQGPSPPPEAVASRTPVRWCMSQLGDLRRRIVTVLTTSPRSRAHMRDTRDERAFVELERSRVQWINDIFMSAGKHGRPDTSDERTMENGLEYAFLLPYCVLGWIFLMTLCYFALYGRAEKTQQMVENYEAKLAASKAQLEASKAAHDEIMSLAK